MESCPAIGPRSGGVEVDLAAGEGEDHVVTVPLEPVDHDHLLVTVVNERGQMPAIFAEVDLVIDTVVRLLLLARVDYQPLAAGLRQVDEPAAVGAEPRRTG